MKKFLHRSFILFLCAYTLFVGLHLLDVAWSPQIALVFLSGIALAILAHARKNYFTIAILVLHMGIEWFEWSRQVLSAHQIAFNCAHAAMDFIFLSHEIKIHAGKYRILILASLTVSLVAIFSFGRSISIEAESLQNLEPFVLGGVLGCICSHLWFHIKKE